MIVIWASAVDDHATELANRWADRNAAVLTARDLSQKGWVCSPSTPTLGRAVVGGQIVMSESIKGVLTRWPRVFPQELHWIEQNDRTYVAAEMTAFLSYWLQFLRCRVSNRPTAMNLLGPDWHPGRWLAMASDIGIPVKPLRIDLKLDGHPVQKVEGLAIHRVVVVGDACFGSLGEGREDYARRLTAKAGVDVIGLDFEDGGAGSRLVGVDLMPEISDGASDALLGIFDATCTQ